MVHTCLNMVQSPTTDMFIPCTYKYIHSWTCMYMYMNIYKCVYYVHTRSWMNIFVCTWYIHVHECKYVYGQSTDTSQYVQLHRRTSIPIRPNQPRRLRSFRVASFLSWTDLVCTVYMHVYSVTLHLLCHMMYRHCIYKVILCIYMYICCTWVLRTTVFKLYVYICCTWVLRTTVFKLYAYTTTVYATAYFHSWEVYPYLNPVCTEWLIPVR